MHCHSALVRTSGVLCLFQLCSEHVHSYPVKVQRELPEEAWTALCTSTFPLELDTLGCISTERPYSLSFDLRHDCFMCCKDEGVSKITAVLLSDSLTCPRRRKLSMIEHLDSHVLHLDILRQCPLACVCLYCLHSLVVDVSAWCELWRHSCIIHHIPSRMCMVPVCQG